MDEIIYRDLKEKFSLSRYFKRLFNAQPGYYRCIVFVVTIHPITFDDTQLNEDIVDYGSTNLPDEIGTEVYHGSYKVTALIYQFKKLENEKNAKFIKPSTIPGQHLLRSGIKNSLR